MKIFVIGLNYNPIEEREDELIIEFKIPAETYNEAVVKLKLLIGTVLAKKCFLIEERDY